MRRPRASGVLQTFRTGALLALCVITVFWKISFTKQYTFLENQDLARQVLPWLDAETDALRHFSLLLWDPYEVGGQSLIGQVQPGVLSPFNWLLAFTPRTPSNHLQVYWVDVWYVFIHIVAAWFAFALLREIGCARAACYLGAVFYATGGYIGNVLWPQRLQAAVWAPLAFLFLIRCLRGKRPYGSAAWAGVAIGLSWLGGHHVPSLFLSLAVFGCGLTYLFVRAGFRAPIAKRLLVTAAVAGAVSAAQMLPAIEYGKLALRWTETGAHRWDERVSVTEHEEFGLKPIDLMHVVVPGGSGLFADPFAGTVALSLAALAVICRFRTAPVRLFSVLAMAALLASMPKNNDLYGFFYALIPLAEKAREPIEAFALVHLSLAVLAALGADLLISSGELVSDRGRIVVSSLLWFGGLTLALYYGHFFFPVQSWIVDDGRMMVLALLALAAAGVYRARRREGISGVQSVALLLLLLVIEQGNETGFWTFVNKDETKRAVYLRELTATQPIGDYLRSRDNPKRVDWDGNEIHFSFGDWYRVESTAAFTASVPQTFQELEPWSDRAAQLFGVGFSVGKSPIHAGAADVFTAPNGLKVFANPSAFPRAWTVHQIKRASDKREASVLTAGSGVDLLTTAIVTGAQPRVETCSGNDQVKNVDESASAVRAEVEMQCGGLLVISDNWYPGWRAKVDGKASPLLQVDSTIRAVALSAGKHRVEMMYRPALVYSGVLALLAGLCAALILGRRRERDGADVLYVDAQRAYDDP